MSALPVKVSPVTKERIRLGAAVEGITQSAFIDHAVAEYLERHKDDLLTRVDAARTALAGGDEALLSYLRGES